MPELIEPLPPPPPPAPVPAGWEGILEPGETILWQGQPDGRIAFRPVYIFPGLFGLAFSGFALFWMLMAAQSGGFFWMFGLLHFAAGIGVMLGGPVGGAWKRRRSFYTLTSRRAIIAGTSYFGTKSLNSYPITAATALEFEDNGALSTVTFHREHWRDSDGDSRSRDIGFEQIEDGRKVLALMRHVQGGQA
jgi:hypothetical protein